MSQDRHNVIVAPTVDAIRSISKTLQKFAQSIEQEASALEEDKDFIHAEICIRRLMDMQQELRVDMLSSLPAQEIKRLEQVRVNDLLLELRRTKERFLGREMTSQEVIENASLGRRWFD